VGYCACGNKLSRSIICGEILDKLEKCWFFTKGSPQWKKKVSHWKWRETRNLRCSTEVLTYSNSQFRHAHFVIVWLFVNENIHLQISGCRILLNVILPKFKKLKQALLQKPNCSFIWLTKFMWKSLNSGSTSTTSIFQPHSTASHIHSFSVRQRKNVLLKQLLNKKHSLISINIIRLCILQNILSRLFTSRPQIHGSFNSRTCPVTEKFPNQIHK